MYRFCLPVVIVGLVAASDALARDPHGRGRGVVSGHTSHHARFGYSAPRYYSRSSYSYHRSYRQPSYRRSYLPAPRYYYPPSRRLVSRSVSVGFSYHRSAPSYYVAAPVVVPATTAPIVYAAPTYSVGDYRVGQYVGGGDYKFKFINSAGRLCKAKVDDDIIKKIELD